MEVSASPSGDRRQQQRVGQDVAARGAAAVGHGQHRHAGIVVVDLHEQRQRPEMRRRPHEDQREHQQRSRRDTPPVATAQPIIGGNAPAAPPMTMFCGVAALQPHRIDDGIEEDGEGQQPGREQVRRERQHHHGEARQRQPEAQRLARARPGRPGSGRLRGAPHHRVDIGIPPHVQRARGAAAQRDEQDRGEADERMHRHRRDQQADQRGEDDQRHDPRLEQREIVAEAAASDGACVGGGGRVGSCLYIGSRLRGRPGTARPYGTAQ